MDQTLNRRKKSGPSHASTAAKRVLVLYIYCLHYSSEPLKSAITTLKYNFCSIDSKISWGITSKKYQNTIWASTYIHKLICIWKNI